VAASGWRGSRWRQPLASLKAFATLRNGGETA
jgi:hypothetical protein